MRVGNRQKLGGASGRGVGNGEARDGALGSGGEAGFPMFFALTLDDRADFVARPISALCGHG